MTDLDIAKMGMAGDKEIHMHPASPGVQVSFQEHKLSGSDTTKSSLTTAPYAEAGAPINRRRV